MSVGHAGRCLQLSGIPRATAEKQGLGALRDEEHAGNTAAVNNFSYRKGDLV